MGKNGWYGIQIIGMIVLIIAAQAAIRQLINHDQTQLWGIFNWVPGGWGGQVLAFAIIVVIGVLLAGFANTKATGDRK